MKFAEVRSAYSKARQVTFRQLRRLAPVLDDVLGAGEGEHADLAVGLAAENCSTRITACTRTRLRKLASTPLNRNNKTLSDLSGGFRERRHDVPSRSSFFAFNGDSAVGSALM
ncbi:hypothetical protein [Paraburkholderia sp. SIMBA_054]|uniref:hypothetical protein n=1 Tax=Paraburkholderia sp. SIMBA_054 TaxID=3085795 RepID=UPI00397BD085